MISMAFYGLLIYLIYKKIKYYDATCINVKKIHDMVYKKYLDNYQIIIVGKKSHPEVLGTNGWCNNEAIIITNIDEVNDDSLGADFYSINELKKSELSKIAILELEKLGYNLK